MTDLRIAAFTTTVGDGDDEIADGIDIVIHNGATRRQLTIEWSCGLTMLCGVGIDEGGKVVRKNIGIDSNALNQMFDWLEGK